MSALICWYRGLKVGDAVTAGAAGAVVLLLAVTVTGVLIAAATGVAGVPAVGLTAPLAAVALLVRLDEAEFIVRHFNTNHCPRPVKQTRLSVLYKT